jgi:enoyl-CoA hydratase/carnithine racemase
MDLKMVARGDGIALRDFVYRLYMDTLDIQFKLRKPTIAVINGPARGAGMTLSITCDMLIAADDVDLGYPEIDIGLVPAIHFVHLPRQLSRHQAFELLFTGKPIPATRAADLGLVNYAVPRADLMTRARALAAVLREKSPTLMAIARTAFHRANDLDYRRNVEAQIAVICNAFETADGREGLAAFAGKRAPAWSGRVPPRR